MLTLLCIRIMRRRVSPHPHGACSSSHDAGRCSSSAATLRRMPVSRRTAPGAARLEGRPGTLLKGIGNGATANMQTLRVMVVAHRLALPVLIGRSSCCAAVKITITATTAGRLLIRPGADRRSHVPSSRPSNRRGAFAAGRGLLRRQAFRAWWTLPRISRGRREEHGDVDEGTATCARRWRISGATARSPSYFPCLWTDEARP